MKFGLTGSFPCSYLPEQQERLLIPVTDIPTAPLYDHLIQHGFRRSGDELYRPHCEHCQACQSLRIPVSRFSASKSQKRILRKNSDLDVRYSQSPTEDYYPLYAKYINIKHRDGSMYPATPEQYQNFLLTGKLQQGFIEVYFQTQLVCVAVCDMVKDALSAIYTFYDPDLAYRSLGRYAILQQIQMARQLQKEFVYLGYQVDECVKMQYKADFYPHQRYLTDQWVEFTKKRP